MVVIKFCVNSFFFSVLGNLLLGRKAMTNLMKVKVKITQSWLILCESKDMTLLMKVCIVKTMVFPVVMYGCESWIMKKAVHQRIDAFKL